MPRTARQRSPAAAHPVELAWTLTREVEEWLGAEERRDAYVKLGAGDTESAIVDLIGILAHAHVDLSADVVAALKHWVAGYPDGTERAALLQLVGSVSVKPDDDGLRAPRYLEISDRYEKRVPDDNSPHSRTVDRH